MTIKSDKNKSTFLHNKNVDIYTNSIGAGGAEKQILLLATILARRGARCVVCTLDKRKLSEPLAKLVDDAQNAGVVFLIPNSNSFIEKAKHVLKVITRIRLSKNAVIWSWGNRTDTICKLFIPRNSGCTLICSLRLASEYAIKRKKSNYSWRRNRVASYISNSAKNIEIFRNNIDIPEERFHILPNAIIARPTDSRYDPRSKEQIEKQIRVAVLGNNRFHHKGYDCLLNVAERCKTEKQSIAFSIAGIDYDRNLEQEISKRQIGDVVNFVGPISDSSEYLCSHDVYLLTSRFEGMPNSLLEAMSLGIPSIATNVGDLRLLFGDRECLQLCPIGDELCLMQSIRFYQQNWNKAIQIGCRGRDIVLEEFSIAEAENKLLSIFRTMLMEYPEATIDNA